MNRRTLRRADLAATSLSQFPAPRLQKVLSSLRLLAFRNYPVVLIGDDGGRQSFDPWGEPIRDCADGVVVKVRNRPLKLRK
jgi:hypothetical protein